MSLPRVSLAVAASVALLSGLVFTGAAAAQDDPPTNPSPACTALVEADAAVVAARNAVDAAGTDVTDLLSAALADARLDATLRLCSPVVVTDDPDPVETTTPAPTTTTPPPATTTTPPPAVTVETVAAEIAALNCDGYGAKTGRIVDDTSALFGRATAEQLGALSDAYNAKLKALNYCVGSSAPATSTTTVNPTQDDGSVANTSGTQVREVPAGSVQTGAV